MMNAHAIRGGRLGWGGYALAAAALVAVTLWAIGLVRFAAAIPRGIDDADTPTDAIVVLTGGSERIATGLRLLAERKAETVFVSGVHPAVRIEDVLEQAAKEVEPVSLAGRVEAGRGAEDTAGNARETADWVRRHGYRSLRLVTGSYHMPRSLLEFSRTLPDVRVIPHPVFPDRVHHRQWWLAPGTAALIISEYNKFLFAWVSHSGRQLLASAGTLT